MWRQGSSQHLLARRLAEHASGAFLIEILLARSQERMPSQASERACCSYVPVLLATCLCAVWASASAESADRQLAPSDEVTEVRAGYH